MVAKDASCGSETYRPYLDIERIINVQSADSITRGHDRIFKLAVLRLLSVAAIQFSVQEG